MKPLNAKYTKILWANIIVLGAGVGFMVYKKLDHALYGVGAGLIIGAAEYIFMRVSLIRKQQKEEEGRHEH